MRLYALHKRQFVAVFAVFFICLFIAILIGIAGPSIIQSTMAPIESPSQQLVDKIFFFVLYFSTFLFI